MKHNESRSIYKRSSGILLHPTSLPGRFGIGDLGAQAYAWLKFLSSTGCRLWQILPLGPTGYGDSPYQCFSAFAGNPYLISPQLLVEDGLLDENDLSSAPRFPDEHVDFGKVITWKNRVFRQAHKRFQKEGDTGLQDEFQQFQQEHQRWLDSYAAFRVLKDVHGGAPWYQWASEYRRHSPAALKKAKEEHHWDYHRYAFEQFLFFRQWGRLKQSATELGITIIGDIPIFVAHDSADVWAHPELFQLKENGAPAFVAGVPPDYFSPTGQLWGNPLYDWAAHREQGYSWWIERVRAVLKMVDLVRLDHFRGFAAYWEIPGGESTAIKGRWAPGPGADFFDALIQALGDLPFIAEDLGVITPDVIALREKYEFPGMKILQFGFEGAPDDLFLPHNYPRNCVAYTGTHDNDTAWGWYARVNEESKDFYRRYLHVDGTDVAWDMIRAIWSSVAMLAIAPLQDFLNLGNEARMNYPGSLTGNWRWRFSEGTLTEELGNKIHELNYLYSRL